jgi:hypothetical protein
MAALRGGVNRIERTTQATEVFSFDAAVLGAVDTAGDVVTLIWNRRSHP